MSSVNGNGNGHNPKPKNVLGGELELCCSDPMTGFYRDGFCRTGLDDTGRQRMSFSLFRRPSAMTYRRLCRNTLFPV